MVSAPAKWFHVWEHHRIALPDRMPEPLTTVGLERQPIKVLTVKWSLLTFIAKHSTKFNDRAYEQNKKVAPMPAVSPVFPALHLCLAVVVQFL